MPRVCTICSDPRRSEIDAMIADKIPFLQIATKFGLNQKTVNTHGTHHVQPYLDKIEREAQAAALDRVLAYRDQVNLPLAEKSKFVEDRLWATLERAQTISEQMLIVREINKQQVEQAKLSGAYQKEGQNQNDLDRVAKAYRKFLDDFPQATDQERDKFLDMFATEAGVSAATIRKQMQIQELGGVQ